jgi:hypothetical protein
MEQDKFCSQQIERSRRRNLPAEEESEAERINREEKGKNRIAINASERK